MVVCATHRIKTSVQAAWNRKNFLVHLLSTPYMLIGTVEQIIERLYTLRERYGVNYFVVPLTQMDELSPVVARLAGV